MRWRPVKPFPVMSATCSISGLGHERDPLRRLADSLLGLSPDSAPDTRLAAVTGIHRRRARRRAASTFSA